MNDSEPRHKRPSINVLQGAYAVSDNPMDEMSTVLGSCIAACLYDPLVKLGGMNHFLLPEPSANSSLSVVHGAQAMELLLNDMLKRGAKKTRLIAKLFGGSKVLRTQSEIGAANATFALKFLAEEGIPCMAKRVGGTNALRVRFHPATGEAFVRPVSKAPAEVRFTRPKQAKPDVTLF